VVLRGFFRAIIRCFPHSPASELSVGWVNPRVGLSWAGKGQLFGEMGWVGSMKIGPRTILSPASGA